MRATLADREPGSFCGPAHAASTAATASADTAARALSSDARQLVEPRALRLVLAIDVPGEEQEATEDDEQRGPEADPEPDPVEDHYPEDADQEERDRRIPRA
jgi:hypothetical protein